MEPTFKMFNLRCVWNDIHALASGICDWAPTFLEVSMVKCSLCYPGMIKTISVTWEHCIFATCTGCHLHPLWPRFRTGEIAASLKGKLVLFPLSSQIEWGHVGCDGLSKCLGKSLCFGEVLHISLIFRVTGRQRKPLFLSDFCFRQMHLAMGKVVSE